MTTRPLLTMVGLKVTAMDDRAYTLCMIGWHISQKRRENITKKKTTSSASLLDSFKIRAPQGHTSIFS